MATMRIVPVSMQRCDRGWRDVDTDRCSHVRMIECIDASLGAPIDSRQG